MGGCIAKVHNKIMPKAPRQDEIVCSRSDLTAYENDLFAVLQRMNPIILLCFVLNVATSVFVHANGERASIPFAYLPGIVSTLSLVPQMKMARATAQTDDGLSLSGLLVFRLSLMFFLLLNVVRLYDENSTRELSCSLAEESFDKDAHVMNGSECLGFVSVVKMASIILYIVTSLMQLAAAHKLEVIFHARNIRTMLADLERGVVMFESDRRPDRRGGEWVERGGLEVEIGDIR